MNDISSLLPRIGRIATKCVCCGSSLLKKSPAILMPFVAHRTFGWEPVEISDDWGLRTIRSGMAYSICNSIQCENCGLLFLDIRFLENEMNALYDGYREEQYVKLRDRYEPGYRERNKELMNNHHYIPRIEKFLSQYLKLPVSVIDWGGDTGGNTPFKENNRLFHIYDISNKPVINGAVKVDKTKALATQYDLIVCGNVLEHIPYPAIVIKDIVTLMNSETVLYIEVPYEEIFQSSVSEKELYKKKKHWHEHINFFTELSLKKLLVNSGLSIIDLETLDASIGGNSAHLYLIACRLQ